MNDLSSHSPTFGIRMRGINPFSEHLPSTTQAGNNMDTVNALMVQDKSFYITKDPSAKKFSWDTQKQEESTIKKQPINATCRELMAEWKYKIVDHFGLSREIVATSFSYLDRLTATCFCDRSVYKLAAMSSLFIATKMTHSHQLNIEMLASLSRREFDVTQLVQMEMIILQTLGWRMCPPTAQAFVTIWGSLLSLGGIQTIVLQRAMFFTEIALFDVKLVSKERALIAIAALLNSMEGTLELSSTGCREILIERIKSIYGVQYGEEDTNFVRKRLWWTYGNTAQREEDDARMSQMLRDDPKSPPTKRYAMKGSDISPEILHSPTSVRSNRMNHEVTE